MKYGPYSRLLHDIPTPPRELQTLLPYLSDAFTLLNDWILQPGEDEPHVLRIPGRAHLSKGEDNQVQLYHPGNDEGRPGYAETYERTEAGAAELRHDIALRATLHTEARSQWNTWTSEPHRPEEIRIALRDAPGYYAQCPLDCEGKPHHVLVTLELAPRDEDPDGARTSEVQINQETSYLLEMLASCVYPLRP